MSVYLYVKVLYLNMNLLELLLCLYICMSVCLGAVLEHEPAGTVVMSVSAIDGDGTYPNNRNIVQFINSLTNSLFIQSIIYSFIRPFLIQLLIHLFIYSFFILPFFYFFISVIHFFSKKNFNKISSVFKLLINILMRLNLCIVQGQILYI